jgi:hypothetical protein
MSQVDDHLNQARKSIPILINISESSSEIGLNEREKEVKEMLAGMKSSLIQEVKKYNFEKPKKDYAKMAGIVRRRQINKEVSGISDSVKVQNPNRVQVKKQQPKINKKPTNGDIMNFSGRSQLTEKERLYIEYFLQEANPQ